MAQTIHCRSCKADSAARDIADLIGRHTNEKGRFCCARCGGTDTFLHAQRRPGAGAGSAPWIKGVVPIDTKTADAAYAPFVFLTAEDPDGAVTGIAFKYYRTTPSNGDGPRRARRPDGGPVLAQSHLLSLVGRLAKIGVVSDHDWREFVRAADARAT